MFPAIWKYDNECQNNLKLVQNLSSLKDKNDCQTTNR